LFSRLDLLLLFRAHPAIHVGDLHPLAQACGESSFAIGVDRSDRPFRGFPPRKTTPRDLYQAPVIAKLLTPLSFIATLWKEKNSVLSSGFTWGRRVNPPCARTISRFVWAQTYAVPSIFYQ
jgi:hypothetical protein